MRKKLSAAIKGICFKLVLAVAFLVFANAAYAAMPILNNNPFTQAQTAIQTLIENAITLGKWIAMASMVVCFLAALTNRFSKETCIKVGIIMAALSGLGWIVELFMGGS